MTISIDVHEPTQAQTLIGQSIPCEVRSLNSDGWADYRWQDYAGSYVHIERKTWGELLTSVDHVEDQLRRHLANQTTARLRLLLEGIAVPNISGSSILRPANREAIYIKGHSSSIRLSLIYAWLYQIGKYVEIYTTPNYETTCIALVAFYKGDQKEEHTTLHRYIKKVDSHPNVQVTQLMGLLPNVGAKRAESLIDRFTTVWNIVSTSPEELATVDGIGKVLSKQILRQVGRTDV